jgi:hypothetical protein
MARAVGGCLRQPGKPNTEDRAAHPALMAEGLDRMDDDTLGGLLLRPAMLANPRGIVLMQSRSITRIERNMQAATNDLDVVSRIS